MLKKFTSAPIMARQVQKFNFGIFDYFKKKTHDKTISKYCIEKCNRIVP